LPWESYYGSVRNILDDALPANFKTFDYFVQSTGEAISNKTLNLLSPGYTNNPNRIVSTLTKYIDDIADFGEHTGGSYLLNASDISTRTLELAIPAAANQGQIQKLMEMTAYAASKGVKLNITLIK
jgi:filamentous hemagglutinin